MGPSFDVVFQKDVARWLFLKQIMYSIYIYIYV